jgi:glycyl-tRNA synthetase
VRLRRDPGHRQRYRRQDELGTPYCVTVDFDSLDYNAVTVRERDSMGRAVPIDDLLSNCRRLD